MIENIKQSLPKPTLTIPTAYWKEVKIRNGRLNEYATMHLLHGNIATRVSLEKKFKNLSGLLAMITPP
jgi:hypothetical protein